MNCTATTGLTADECLARLAAYEFDFSRPKFAARIMRLRNEMRALREDLSRTQTALARLQRELAGATERLGQHLYCVEHEQFDCTMVCAAALREALSDVTGRPCEKQGRWCHTHQCKDCSIDDARKLLGEP